MKLILFASLVMTVLLVGINQAYAENSLENEHLFAESATITLDLQFGDDDIKYRGIRTITTSTLDSIALTFYGDSIPISSP